MNKHSRFGNLPLQKIADVPETSEGDANAAVAAAKAAFPAWSKISPDRRAVPVKKLARLLLENSEELARLEAVSMGRPVDSYSDAAAAASQHEHYAEAWGADPGPPVGVVAGIILWNVPIYYLANKTAPALAAGNTVVLKSSEKASLTSARVAELVIEAGFPAGVFNILSGHGQTSGAVLACHHDVRVLSFTGSGRTGRLIQEMAASSNLKKVVLELGGKKANNTEFGLYASVYTRDISRAMRISTTLESGFVGVNCTSPSIAHDLPFGGYKMSGQGREGWPHSLDSFLETKSVIIKVDRV